LRVLVVGAGAIGGYFGARLLERGRDVTFLVRPRRAAQLATGGLEVSSRFGDVHVSRPSTVTAHSLRGRYDLIVLGCKAYDLDGVIEAIGPVVGPATTVLPLLNGMRHLDELDRRFGPDRVLGGLCVISAVLDAEGRILHLNDLHTLVFGERNGRMTERIAAIARLFEGATADVRASATVVGDMWEKWVFIASMAGINCLLRGSVGEVVGVGAAPLAERLLAECASISASEGYPPGEAALERSRAMLTMAGSPLTASMLRDIERGAPTEGGHIIGDLLRRGADRSVPTPLLEIADAHVRVYEHRRAATPG
jgi:2-dehydropantoate 2-reductase